MIFYIPKFRQGGLEKVFAKYLLDFCHNRKVTLLCDRSSKSYLPIAILENENINCVYLPDKRILRILSLWAYLICNRGATVNAVQIDALKSVLLLSVIWPIKIIYHERTFVTTNQLTFVLRVLRFGYANLSKILVNSDDQKALFKTYFSSVKVCRLNNPIINETLRDLRQFRIKHYKAGEHRVLLCSGRLDGQKNIRFIIENAERICREASFSKILIYLSDEDYDDSLNCNYVTISRFNYDFLNEIVLVDAALVTTNFEGFSSFIFELGYLGIPIACNPHKHGFEELSSLFNLYTFERNNIDELIRALKNMKTSMSSISKNDENRFLESSSLKDFGEKITNV